MISTAESYPDLKKNDELRSENWNTIKQRVADATSDAAAVWTAKFLFFVGAGAIALGVAAFLVEGVAPPSAAELGSTGVSEAWFEALEAFQKEQRSGFVALAFVVGVALVLAGMLVRDLRGFVTLHTQDLAARDQIALHGERPSTEA